MTKTIQEFMTKAPHGIDPHEPITVARSRMRELKVRHLPVRSGGKLVGILTERDLDLLTGIKSVDVNSTKVGDVMVADPYCVKPLTALKEVATTMAENKFGSAMVVNETGEVIGIFTDTDALKALAKFS
jgi:acetoin utilization protein AcuB